MLEGATGPRGLVVSSTPHGHNATSVRDEKNFILRFVIKKFIFHEKPKFGVVTMAV